MMWFLGKKESQEKTKKITVITGKYETTFMHQVNEFMASHPDIVGIQYQYGGEDVYSVMIVYEE